MDYSKFYTPPAIAEFLVNQLNIEYPKNIADICCGSCNLLHAARQRWPEAEAVGVDVAEHDDIDVHFTQCDGRIFAARHPEEFPLVLANPPFDSSGAQEKNAVSYAEIPEDCKVSRLEIEMLFANLQILKPSGTLAIILPITVVVGEKFAKIRKHISQYYHVQKIIYFPDDIFGAANISSCALIIKKESPVRCRTYRYTLERQSNAFKITKGTCIPRNLMLRGEWHSILKPSENVQLPFYRGNISSHYFVKHGVPILHTAKQQSSWVPSVRYITEIPKNAVYVHKNDILISRIGKSAGQWIRYCGPKMPISDCLYALKDPEGRIYKKIKGKSYSIPCKGVATRYITKKDFISWIESLQCPAMVND